MTNFVEIMEKVAGTTKRLEKEEYLKNADDIAKQLLRLATDQQIVFGVTCDEDTMSSYWKSDGWTNEVFWQNIIKLCNKLSSRELTGNRANDEVAMRLLSTDTELDVHWACRVISKDLRAGISIATINKVFPKLSSKFEVALANQYNPEKHTLEGNYCVEPKLDGLRMVVVAGSPYTRNGKQITTVKFVIEDLEKQLTASRYRLSEFVFDGELMGEGTFDEASGVARRKDVNSDTLKYHVFDAIDIAQWHRKATDALSSRKMLLGQLLKTSQFIKPTDWKLIPQFSTAADLFAMRDEFIRAGFEGAMIKNLDAPYRFKRSDDLLKFKDFLDADGEVVDFFEGRGKYKGMLGGLIAEFYGVQTRVGSGFNDEMRNDFWNIRRSLIGKTTEVKYQQKTKDGVLRFPVFLKIRNDK